MRTLISTAIAFLLAVTLGAVVVGHNPAAEACPPPREPLPAANLTGAYHSNYGLVMLQQTGARITGSYDCCGGGTLTGIMRGDTITYTWEQPGARGQGVWRFSEGALTGTWGWDGSHTSGGAWNLQRAGVTAVAVAR